MINAIFFLVFVSFFGFLKLRVKQDRVVSWFMLIGALTLTLKSEFFFGVDVSQNFSFLWNKTQLGNITIDYFSTTQFNQLVICAYISSILMIFINNIFRYEEKSSFFNSIILLNLIIITLLIGGTNCVQLLTAVFIVDILGYILINNVDSSHKFVMYNFISDIFLFMVLALICGRLGRLEMDSLIDYKRIGHHKDFVSVMLLISILIKIGSFMFQGYLLAISNTRFQRIIAINLFFAPLVGVILLLRLKEILLISNLFIPIYVAINIISILYGFIYFIKSNYLLQKVIYLNMSFLSFLLLIIYGNDFVWVPLLSYYYISVFFINLLFFSIYLALNREQDLYIIQSSRIQNLAILRTNILLATLVLNIFIGIVYKIAFLNFNQYYILTSIVFAIIISLGLAQIYYLAAKQTFNHHKLKLNSYLFLIVGLALVLYYSYILRQYGYFNILIVSSILSFIYILKFISQIFYKDNQIAQKDIIVDNIFKYIFVKPMLFISRRLWIIFDFVVSEKFINFIIEHFYKQIIYLFLKLNKKTLLSFILFLFIGIGIFLLSIYQGGYFE